MSGLLLAKHLSGKQSVRNGARTLLLICFSSFTGSTHAEALMLKFDPVLQEPIRPIA